VSPKSVAWIGVLALAASLAIGSRLDTPLSPSMFPVAWGAAGLSALAFIGASIATVANARKLAQQRGHHGWLVASWLLFPAAYFYLLTDAPERKA
jgi:hypothetical protein